MNASFCYSMRLDPRLGAVLIALSLYGCSRAQAPARVLERLK